MNSHDILRYKIKGAVFVYLTHIISHSILFKFYYFHMGAADIEEWFTKMFAVPMCSTHRVWNQLRLT